MSIRESQPAPLSLVSVSGPKPVNVEITSHDIVTIGRRKTCTIVLDELEVSRVHATLSPQRHGNRVEWMLVDEGSNHGTFINGVRLQPHQACPVQPGDSIRIQPWTLCLIDHSTPADAVARVQTVDDSSSAAGSTVTSIQSRAGGEDLAHERLMLLLHCAEALQRAADEHELAEIGLAAAISGTGYANGAITGPMNADGTLPLLVSRGDIQSTRAAQPTLSRTLIRAASQGTPAQLLDQAAFGEAISIAQFGIQQAICVPLMNESAVAGFLYLDNRQVDHRARQGMRRAVAEDAGAFAVGVGRLVSMAWSNLMRRDLERRIARIEGELQAAARAQQMILPQREGRFGSLMYIGECRPGRVVSGDFFDVVPLPDGRVAVTIGDVVGKGVPAAVMMTTTQGFLHGALRQHGDVATALAEVNRYAAQRSDMQRFVTLWTGIFDPQCGTLTYCDAGHGYAWILRRNDVIAKLTDAGGPPIAIAPYTIYRTATVDWQPHDRVLLVSDGIIEQGSGGATAHPSAVREQFGTARVEQILRNASHASDEVASIFQAVFDHASGRQLADDATVVCIRRCQ